MNDNSSLPHIPLHEEGKDEFSKGKSGIVICKVCNASYFKKSWHHNLANYGGEKEDTEIEFVLCPTCKMISNNQFEGEIILKNIPEKIIEELKNLIHNSGKQAYDHDPMDRVISVEDYDNNGLRIIVSENQTANKITQKIKDTFENLIKDSKVSFSSEPSDVFYSKIEFK